MYWNPDAYGAFWGNALNEKFNEFISNSNKSSMPESLCEQMERRDMNYSL